MMATKLETWSEEGREAIVVGETVRSGDACPHCGGVLVSESMDGAKAERWQRWAAEVDSAVAQYGCRKCRGIVIAVVAREPRR